MKKTNNKGFSLVELIVVVAIMAVLMVVVGPQLLRYVERSRIQRDNTAISEIANAAKIAMADETINGTIANGAHQDIQADATGVFTFTAGTGTLLGELNLTLGATLELDSNAYTAGAQPGIRVAKDGTGNVTVTSLNLVEQDGSTDLDVTY